MSDREIFLIEVARPGTPGTPTPGDYATMRSDVAALKLNPVINRIQDIPNVDQFHTPANLDTIFWNDLLGEWGYAPAAIIGVIDTGSINLTLDGGDLSADVLYGGTGSAATAARSDHGHTVASAQRATFDATGGLSSGSRTLATLTPTLASGLTYLVLATLTVQVRGGGVSDSYYSLRVTIDGNARTSAAGANGRWAVQNMPKVETWKHSREIDGTGAAVTITAQILYASGSSITVDAGELDITLIPNR